MLNIKNRKLIWGIGTALLVVFLFCIITSYVFTKGRNLDIANAIKKITLNDDGLVFENIISQAGTVSEFIKEQKINLGDNDFIFPSKDAEIFSGSRIIIEREKNVTIVADGKTAKHIAYGKNVAGALWENKVNLGEDDFTKPALNYPLRSGDKIEVIRVDIKEEAAKKEIPFKTKTNEDDKLGWRTKKVTQKGEKGIKEITYKVISHNGKEISRKVMSEIVTKDPVAEIATQGTYVKLGKSHTGLASWYAYTGTLSAASPWLPMGSYVKVTNKENGKSVIVKINDRGPFGNGRIIDLDKVAFAKIAGLGQGVINVKMEEIIN